MLASAHAACLVGTQALPVSVEVRLGDGLPAIDIVGLPERGVRESRVRVKSALSAIDFRFPPRHLVLNLAPGDLRKTGSGFDLAIAMSVMAACGAVRVEALEEVLLIGELALSGELRPVRGVLAKLLSARDRGLRAAVVPAACAREASLVDGICVYTAGDVGDVVRWLNEEASLPRVTPLREGGPAPTYADLCEVRGQPAARRVLEIAAAGAHHTLLIGSPGSGKTMLARCLPSILPPPTRDEALEIAAIASAAGFATPLSLTGVVRPFRAPHHTASAASLVGGGEPVRAGELTLAHRGVLFLDELPEFRRDTIETLRTAAEEGRVVVMRVRERVTMPAEPMIVAAMNPCPCGYASDKTRGCSCSSHRAAAYRNRVSGPLLDRFDLHVQLQRVSAREMREAELGEPSRVVRARVCAARQSLEARGQMESLGELTRGAEKKALATLERGVESLKMSARGYVKALRVAHTIAALEGSSAVQVPHVAEALQYRVLDRPQS